MDIALDHRLGPPPLYGEHLMQSAKHSRHLWNGVSLLRWKSYDELNSIAPDVIVINSASVLLHSGFPYQNVLASVSVPRQSWVQFTTEIRDSIKETSADRLRIILCGLATGVISFFVVGPLSFLLGISSMRSITREVEREMLLQNSKPCKPLTRTMQEWNEFYFMPRNLHVRLDVPNDWDMEELPWQGASGRSSRHRPRHSRCYREANLRITMQQDMLVCWVEGLVKPRLVITRVPVV